MDTKVFFRRIARLACWTFLISPATGRVAAEASEAPGPEAAVVLQHGQVFYAEGRFGGWPANNGMWAWGDEILVGYVEADHQERRGHTYDRSTARKKFARSLDGGETWTVEDGLEQGITGLSNDHRLGDQAEPLRQLEDPIDFTHPDFAMTLRRENNHDGPSHFYYSYDRGKSWQGPFAFPNLDTHGIPARTDYLVDGPHEMLVFLTAAKSNRREGRIFCARTTDGGVTWERVAWIGPEPPGFSIMPSSVRLSPERILTVIRHRDGPTWLTAYRSEDNAATWQPLDDPVTNNLNSPPALLQLEDGRLLLVYVDRRNRDGTGSAVCAKISADEGESWSEEIVLRGEEGATGDVGYPVVTQRPDGRLVTVYYWNHARDSQRPPYRYIGFTIFELSSEGD